MPILWRLLNRLKQSQLQREAPLLQRAVDASSEKNVAGSPGPCTTVWSGPCRNFLHHWRRGGARHVVGPARPGRRGPLGGRHGTSEHRRVALPAFGHLPPSLVTAGLEAALNDLASTLRARGTAVLLDIGRDTGLDAAGERLVYRVAQECLHNIARHAAATRTSRCASNARSAPSSLQSTTTVSGSMRPTCSRTPKEGHFGLRVLGDVVAEAGGGFLLASAPGAGTHWQLRIPLP